MTPIGRWPIDEPLPAVLRDADLMRVLGIGKSRYCVNKRLGAYRFLEMRPQIDGQGTLYSGRQVQTWVDGGGLQAPAPHRAPRAMPRRAPARSQAPRQPREFAIGRGR
jgi:hypothetical protein